MRKLAVAGLGLVLLLLSACASSPSATGDAAKVAAIAADVSTVAAVLKPVAATVAAREGASAEDVVKIEAAFAGIDRAATDIRTVATIAETGRHVDTVVAAVGVIVTVVKGIPSLTAREKEALTTANALASAIGSMLHEG